jgi:hypothetical protein
LLATQPTVLPSKKRDGFITFTIPLLTTMSINLYQAPSQYSEFFFEAATVLRRNS